MSCEYCGQCSIWIWFYCWRFFVVACFFEWNQVGRYTSCAPHFRFIQRKWLLSTDFRAKLTKCAPYEMSWYTLVMAIFNARSNHLGILTDWNEARFVRSPLDWRCCWQRDASKAINLLHWELFVRVSVTFVLDSVRDFFFFLVGFHYSLSRCRKLRCSFFSFFVIRLRSLTQRFFI